MISDDELQCVRESTPRQENFLLNEMWMSSWRGAVQRNSLYKPDKERKEKIRDRCRREFREEMICFARKMIFEDYLDLRQETDSGYCKEMEDKHERNIIKIARHGSKVGCNILRYPDIKKVSCEKCCRREYKFKISAAQKFLNLQLKYMWCFGKIYKPPHCPIDSIILGVAGIDNVSWTDINCMECYKNVIARLKKTAQSCELSLSEWELKKYRVDNRKECKKIKYKCEDKNKREEKCRCRLVKTSNA